MRVLAADIGGTNSRFALFETQPLRMRDSVSLSSDVPDFPTLLDRLEAARPDMAPERVDCLSIAIAGPIEEAKSRGGLPERGYLSNQPWFVDVPQARAWRQFGPALLINDFTAQAWACTVPGLLDEAMPILKGEPCPDCVAPRALIGAGTGLGEALLMPMPDGSECIFPSEGGHAAFPFVEANEDANEYDFGRFVADRKGLSYARGDDIVTGPGLALLHEYLTGEQRRPADFTSDASFAESATRRMFSRFYGRVARTLALTSLPMSGLIITGGLAANRPFLVDSDEFRHEFLHVPPPHRDVIARIPVILNLNQSSGLWGAAQAATRFSAV